MFFKSFGKGNLIFFILVQDHGNGGGEGKGSFTSNTHILEKYKKEQIHLHSAIPQMYLK